MRDAVTVTIRPATTLDCAQILEAHTQAIRVLCLAEYSETQLAGWAERLTPEGYLPAIERNIFLVAEHDGRVVGFGELSLDRAEVVATYVHPEFARGGVGTQILRSMMNIAERNGVGALHLSSSLSAVPFYERLGFVPGKRSVHRLGNGTEIPCIAMSRG